jgi:PiT family inorganic phosphate transporter
MVAVLLFLALLGIGVLFTAYSLQTDIVQSGMPTQTWLPFLMLGVALVIALGFESSTASTIPPTPSPP